MAGCSEKGSLPISKNMRFSNIFTSVHLNNMDWNYVSKLKKEPNPKGLAIHSCRVVTISQVQGVYWLGILFNWTTNSDIDKNKQNIPTPGFWQILCKTQTSQGSARIWVTAHWPPWGFSWCPVLLQTTWKASYFPKGGKWLLWDSIGTIDPRGPDSPAAEGNKEASVLWKWDGRKIILAEPALSSENSFCQKIPN